MDKRLLARNSVKMYGAIFPVPTIVADTEDEAEPKYVKVKRTIKYVERNDETGEITLNFVDGGEPHTISADTYCKAWKLQNHKLKKRDPLRRSMNFTLMFERLCRPATCTTPLEVLLLPYHNDPSQIKRDPEKRSIFAREFGIGQGSYDELQGAQSAAIMCLDEAFNRRFGMGK